MTPVDFVKNQEKMLQKIVQHNASSSLYKHLGIAGLKGEKDFSVLYDNFKRQVPVYTYLAFVGALQRMTGQMQAGSLDLLKQQLLVSAEKIKKFALVQQGVVPVCDSYLQGAVQNEKYMVDLLNRQGIKAKKIFHIYENQTFDVVDGYEVGSIGAIYSRSRPFWWRRRFLPDDTVFTGIGRSRYQTLHAFIDQLYEHGKQVDVLVVRPRSLSEISLLLAQREGRFVPLKQLCPNLKAVVHYGIPLTIYQKEISFFTQGLNLQFREMYIGSSGVFGLQEDVNIKHWLTLRDDTGVFYEFIPVEDVDDSGRIGSRFRRYYAGQLERGRKYLLVVNNLSGLVGYSTNDVVRVESTVPLRVSYQHPVYALNDLGESLNLGEFEKLIAEINDALAGKGLFIREYMIGDSPEKKQQFWVMELSRAITDVDKKVLQSIANRLHTELCYYNKNYHMAYKLGQNELPLVYFVSMGTLSNIPDRFQFSHIDKTPGLAMMRAVLGSAWGKVVIQPYPVEG